MPDKILLVNEDSQNSASLHKGISQAGYSIQAELTSFPRVLMECHKRPVAIICNIAGSISSQLHFFSDLKKLNPLPTVVFVSQASKQELEQGIKSGIHALIVNGLNESRIPSIIEMAIIRFTEQQLKEQELYIAKRNLEDRKIIDRAKGILMDSRGMKEEEAYTSLRKMAMNQNKRLSDVCQDVIALFKYIA